MNLDTLYIYFYRFTRSFLAYFIHYGCLIEIKIWVFRATFKSLHLIKDLFLFFFFLISLVTIESNLQTKDFIFIQLSRLKTIP